MKLKTIAASLAIAAAPLLCTSTVATAQTKFITVGTGGITGVYYIAGGAICRVVNKDRAKHGLRCSTESTAGSVFNVNTISQGEMDFGVAQSDVQFNSFNGINQWKDKPFKELRALFSLHAEPLTMVARNSAKVTKLEDIKGKRVNIGNPGSGQRAATEELFAHVGMKFSDLSLASELKPDEHSQALCDNKIDAFFYTVGHPAGNIQEATTSCDSTLVSLSGPTIDKLVASKPYYSYATIPGGMYRGNMQDIKTYGVTATLVASSKTSADVVYQVVRGVFENFDEFRKLHPAFNNLDAKTMIKSGLSAPLHEGAIKYYKEKGWM
jgi:uncharacterized protein